MNSTGKALWFTTPKEGNRGSVFSDRTKLIGQRPEWEVMVMVATKKKNNKKRGQVVWVEGRKGSSDSEKTE